MKKLALVVGLLFGMSAVMVHAQGYPSSSQPDQTSPQTSGQQPDSTMQQQPSSSQQSPASATQAQASVQKALQQDPSLSSAVSAQAGSDNKLVLSGTVPTQADKDRAEQMARSAAGNDHRQPNPGQRRQHFTRIERQQHHSTSNTAARQLFYAKRRAN